MSHQFLLDRAAVLQVELQKAKQNVISATEQLETARSHLCVVNGHFNEINYLIIEEQKNKGDQENVEADNKDAD